MRQLAMGILKDVIDNIITEQQDITQKNIKTDNQLDRTVNMLKKNYPDITQDDKDRVENIVSSTKSTAEDIAVKIKEKNLVGDAATDIINQAKERGDLMKLSDYLESYETQITLASIQTGKHNLIDMMVKKGFSKEFSKWLMGYTRLTQPVTGATEIALAVILKDGRITKGNEQGDIKVDEEDVEVKGDYGNLRSTKGIASPTLVRKAIAQHLSNLLEKAGLPAIGNDVNKQKAKGSKKMVYSPDFNWQKDSWQTMFNMGFIEKDNWAHEVTLSYLFTQGLIKKEDRIELYRVILDAYFMNDKNIKMHDKWLVRLFDKDGNIDKKQFLIHWMAYAYEYYKKTDNFKYMLICNKKTGDIVCIKDDLLKEYDKTVKMLSRPNLTDDAGIQGVSFAIGLKTGSEKATAI